MLRRRAGRMSVTDTINKALRRLPAWPIYPASLAYALWLWWLGLTGGLGAEPIRALERAEGRAALYLLVAGLAITPLRRYLGLNLLKFRRAIGLAFFFFVLLHLVTWAVLDVQRLDRVWADIVKRPYITIGMVGFVLLIPLAVTSNNWSVRKLGAAAWRRLHQLTYVAAILGGTHYVMLVKGWQPRPLVFMAIIAVLLAMRVIWARPRGRAGPLAAAAGQGRG